MRTHITRLFILLTTLMITACSDYVEIDPVGNTRVLKYTADYRALANNTSNFQNSGGIYLISSAEIKFPENYQDGVSTIWANAYTWQDPIYNETQSDADWNNLYKAIYYSNVIIDGVMESERGTEGEKQEILAEAYVHRAFAYLQLVNTYAPQFDPQGANTAKAVPLLTTPNLYTELDRSSVSEVYDQILSDLQKSLDNSIQVNAEFNTLPTKATTYALLARTYLYMGNYDLALDNSLEALALENSLIDLNSFSSGYDYPPLFENPEILLSKTLLYSYNNAPLSEDLLMSFEDDDLRYDYYTIDGANVYPSFTGRAFGISSYSFTTGINVGPSVPELYLIAAEAYTRSNALEDALKYLNDLREKRYETGSDYELNSNSASEILDYVFKERSKELIGRGFRWFDQKRLNLKPESQQTFTRIFKGENYVLEPNSNGYVFPVLQNYIDLNPELGE